MATYSSRAYLVGSSDLRDQLITELAAAGIAAVAGGDIDAARWVAAKRHPRLVFVRGETIPNGVMPITVRRCHYHRDRNEAISPRGPTLDGTTKLCSECRAARLVEVSSRATFLSPPPFAGEG
jgi:hypothetical protein